MTAHKNVLPEQTINKRQNKRVCTGFIWLKMWTVAGFVNTVMHVRVA